MNKQKILIVIGDVGGGHRSAAKALTQVIKDNYAERFSVKTIDLFTRADVAPFNTSNATYAFTSQNYTMETVSNFMFRVCSSRLGFPLYRKYVLSRMFKPSLEIIKHEKPDIVIANHPIVTLILSEVKKEMPQVKFVSLITDLVTLLRGWADDNYDLVISPTATATQTLKSWGVQKNKISPPLFPINPYLKNFRNKNTVLEELNLDPELPVVLLTGGGVGTKAMLRGMDNIAKDENVQLLIITGKLTEFRKQLQKKYSTNPTVATLGFVENMQDYLNAADIVVTKPGPATILEIELFQKQAILTRKVGIQEIGNIHYALQNPNFRYINDHWDKLSQTVNELLASPYKEFPARRNFNEATKIVELF